MVKYVEYTLIKKEKCVIVSWDKAIHQVSELGEALKFACESGDLAVCAEG